MSIVPLPDNVATAHAKAPREAVKSPLPARVALACSAPDTSADSPQIPESVATAERISQRFALLIVPLPSIVASIFLPRAPEPVKAQVPLTPTLLQTPPDLGGSTQE